MNGFVEEKWRNRYGSSSEWYLTWVNPFLSGGKWKSDKQDFRFTDPDYRDRARDFPLKSHSSFGLWGAFAEIDQFS